MFVKFVGKPVPVPMDAVPAVEAGTVWLRSLFRIRRLKMFHLCEGLLALRR